MTIVITRTGKGTSISQAENDGNLSSLAGINEPQTGATYTVVAADQNRTIEFSRGTAIAVTMTVMSTILSAIDTDDFKVTLKNIGAGTVTVTRGGTDTFDGGGTTITLEQGDAITIQSDSTEAIWNIIYGNVTQTGTQTLTNKTLTSPVIDTGVSGTAILDEDDMATDSNTQLATQQSIKAYSDSKMGLDTLQNPGGSQAITFTIPAGTKKITISFFDTARTASEIYLQLSTSGGYVTSGYVGGVLKTVSDTSITKTANTSYFHLTTNLDTTEPHSGTVTLTLLEGTNDIWTCTGSLSRESNGTEHRVTGGVKLSGELTEIKIGDPSLGSFVSRTDDTINCIYEK